MSACHLVFNPVVTPLPLSLPTIAVEEDTRKRSTREYMLDTGRHSTSSNGDLEAEQKTVTSDRDQPACTTGTCPWPPEKRAVASFASRRPEKAR